jgi:hypothetical protein
MPRPVREHDIGVPGRARHVRDRPLLLESSDDVLDRNRRAVQLDVPDGRVREVVDVDDALRDVIPSYAKVRRTQ